jgi:glyceraldehyde-3-phosphate dehydrogenase/erythrose-4-phosphate dehydrogenase
MRHVLIASHRMIGTLPYHRMKPANIQWGSVGAEYIVESTGAFLSTEAAGAHLNGWSLKHNTLHRSSLLLQWLLIGCVWGLV